jgi:ferric-dicitrate binding protein FerR (iron transport regulator)
MPDQRVIELFTRKMAGEATAAEIKELEQYLESSSNAEELKELMEEIWQSPAQQENADLFYRRHLENHASQFDWARPDAGKKGVLISPSFKWGLRIACVLAGLAIAGYLLFSPKKGGVEKRVHPSEIAAGKGVRKTVHLPDGTTVWLNADSRLVYDEHMKEETVRSVSLMGEAFFDVAHDKDRPFIIHTSQISIRVLGTSFNVKAYPNESRCEATLLNGSIELSINNRPQQKIILRPSEKFALVERGVDSIKDNGGKSVNTALPAADKPTDLTLSIESIRPIAIDHHSYLKETSWKDNRLVFDSETFKELKAKLERWYNVRIDIEGERINNYHFTGIFTTETIDQVLTAMKLIKPFNYKMNNNEIIIY